MKSSKNKKPDVALVAYSDIHDHFNWGRDHPASALQPDGTCKGRHACDAWVSNKGKEGKCLNSAGTPGHGRHNCDNPNRCDGPAGQ